MHILDKWTVFISHLSFSPKCLADPRKLVQAIDEDQKILFLPFFKKKILLPFSFEEDLIQSYYSQTLPDIRITQPAGHTMELWVSPQLLIQRSGCGA